VLTVPKRLFGNKQAHTGTTNLLSRSHYIVRIAVYKTPDFAKRVDFDMYSRPSTADEAEFFNSASYPSILFHILNHM
jgi:hypothetical protein